ncbi:MAG: hypothetical protein EXS16_00420 [Gemmataceae bacterium]|nr:hypothetical protein [Gemmataceae bacterium]
MKRMVAYVLSFATILVLVAGCGKGRQKRQPVLVANERDYIFDTRVNNSKDLIEVIKPAKGPASEFEVELGSDMLLPSFVWKDTKYFTRNPKWPDPPPGDPQAPIVLDAAIKRYEKALESYQRDERVNDMKAIGKYYMTFANVEKKERYQQSFDNWQQYLRRQGDAGTALRKKLDTSAFEMAMTCDVTVPGQIVAFWKEPEKDGTSLVLTVGKDASGAILGSLKPDKVPEFVEAQTTANFSAAYLDYAKEVGSRKAEPSVEGLRDYVKQKSYPAFAKMIEEKTIMFVDFTQPKMQYVAVLRNYVNKQGTAVLTKSGSFSRVNDAVLAKLAQP